MQRRNYGCRIDDNYIYRGMRTLVMENEIVRISILLDKGTDIFEFLHKPTDTDFMWQSPWGMRDARQHIPSRWNESGNFNEWYHGGWQELFPIAGVGTKIKNIYLGQHGEVCQLPWRHQILSDTADIIQVKLEVDTYQTPFHVEKILTLKSGSGVLEINETLINTGKEPLDCMWGHHPAFGYPFLDEGCFIDIPGGLLYSEPGQPEIKKYRVPPDTSAEWPNIKNRNGDMIDFSVIPPRSEPNDDMMFVKKLKGDWYALTNPKRGVGFGMSFDSSIFQTLWIWQVLGGQLGYPGWGNMYVMAIEPVSGIAPLEQSQKDGTTITIDAGKSLSTKLCAVAFENNKHIKNINFYQSLWSQF